MFLRICVLNLRILESYCGNLVQRMASNDKERVLLAYSGGLDTSCILKWLLEAGYYVICFMADVGQNEDFTMAKEKALLIGASDVSVQEHC